jgi:hypothetical protein
MKVVSHSHKALVQRLVAVLSEKQSLRLLAHRMGRAGRIHAVPECVGEGVMQGADKQALEDQQWISGRDRNHS